LTTLLSANQSEKFKELKENPQASDAVYLQPEPKQEEPENL
jgi:hypothetical protein